MNNLYIDYSKNENHENFSRNQYDEKIIDNNDNISEISDIILNDCYAIKTDDDKNLLNKSKNKRKYVKKQDKLINDKKNITNKSKIKKKKLINKKPKESFIINV